MDIQTFADLTTPDERSLRFTPLGLATGGKLSPENAAEFQQRAEQFRAAPDRALIWSALLRRVHAGR